MGVGQTRWMVQLTDYFGSPWGRVQDVRALNYVHPLLNMRTGGFAIDLENPAATWLMNAPENQPPLAKFYRTTMATNQTQLLLVGDVAGMSISNRSTEGAAQLVSTVADPFWRLNKRLVGTGSDGRGRGVGYTYGTALAQTDLVNIFTDLLTTTNNNGFTGIIRGAVGTSSNGYAGPWFGQNIGQAMQQLSALSGGPDFQIEPLEPVITSGHGGFPTIGQLSTYHALSTIQHDAVFEYGVGQRNVSSYNRAWDRNGQINQVYSLPQGFPDAVAAGDYIVKVYDPASIAAIGMWEDLLPSDVTTVPLREALGSDFITVRRVPRNQITFQPVMNCPVEYGVHYLPGDIVTARAVEVATRPEDNDITIYDGTTRVFQVDMSVGDNDEEQASLTLVPS